MAPTNNRAVVYMGVSENSVPLNPMVNDHYPYEKWLFHLGYTQHFQINPYSFILGQHVGGWWLTQESQRSSRNSPASSGRRSCYSGSTCPWKPRGPMWTEPARNSAKAVEGQFWPEKSRERCKTKEHQPCNICNHQKIIPTFWYY